MFSALARITAAGDDPRTLALLSRTFRSLVKNRREKIFHTFQTGTRSDLQLIDVRMEQSLSIYVGCRSQKSVRHLDSAYESGNLLAVLRECSSSVVDGIDIKRIRWDAADFNRCIQYFRNLSGNL